MTQRVFIKVVGFTDVERHALNTVFRLSEDQAVPVQYALWAPEAPEAAQLILVDADSYEGPVEAEAPYNEALVLIWVGPNAPERAWRVFDRPLVWSDVIHAMDELFAPPAPLDFDLDFGDTQPPAPEAPRKRALIASADRDERLYMRAKLSLVGLTQADEAESGPQALELMRGNTYQVALVDLELPQSHGWDFVRQLTREAPQIPHVIVTKARARWLERLRARLSGARACLDNPPDPVRLQGLLERV